MSHLSHHLLIAAGGDFWETLFGVVLVIMWLVGQFLAGRQEVQKAKKKPRPRQKAEPIDLVVVEDKQQRPRNQEEALRSEVEEFLRRSQEGPKKDRRPVAQTTRQPKPQELPTPRQAAKKLSTRSAGSTAAKRDLRSESVADHVSRHLSTDDISAHASSLGSTIITADDRIDARLHEKFDHGLGRIATDATPELKVVDTSGDPDKTTSGKSNTAATQIADMLRSPQGMRQLIIANEILKRPEY